MSMTRRDLLRTIGGAVVMAPWARSAWAEDAAPVVLMSRPASDAHLGRNLLRILADRPENLVVSPSSIAASLRLAQLGARGETERELSLALGSREAGRLDLDNLAQPRPMS